VRTAAVQDAERALADKQGELAKMMGELDEQSVIADSQKIEIVALKTQVEALKERLSDAEKEVKTTEDRVAHERIELKDATAELSAERGKVENLGHRVAELEQHLVAQTTEAEMLGRRAHDLENRLTEQSRALTESEFELRQLREQVETARKTEGDLRTAIAEIDGRASSATEVLKAEKIQLQAELDRANDERSRLTREISDMKRDTEQAWSSERVENALLRERINDVAAEVARLASTLEGPNSPIDAILAAETARDKGAMPPVESVEVEVVGEPIGGGNLADRIRALQSRASRIPQPDEPTSRN
jgi:chromosome segregation ATPase